MAACKTSDTWQPYRKRKRRTRKTGAARPRASPPARLALKRAIRLRDGVTHSLGRKQRRGLEPERAPLYRGLKPRGVGGWGKPRGMGARVGVPRRHQLRLAAACSLAEA